MTLFPNNPLINPVRWYTPQPTRYVATSRAGRRHLIGADIINAVHVGFENVQGTAKARKRLGQLLARLQRALGDRSPDGGGVEADNEPAQWAVPVLRGRGMGRGVMGAGKGVVREAEGGECVMVTTYIYTALLLLGLCMAGVAVWAQWGIG